MWSRWRRRWRPRFSFVLAICGVYLVALMLSGVAEVRWHLERFDAQALGYLALATLTALAIWEW